MGRGGVRSNSGAKSKWKHGKTKMIRVPEDLADQILEFAHKLDEKGIIDSDSESNIIITPKVESESESKVLNLAGISIRICDGKSSVYLEDLAKAGYTLYPERLGKIFKAVVARRMRT